MGFTRKNTADKLDKIVQFVHHYQTLHPGDTPSMKAIANELDVHPGSVTWFLNLLIDDNRVEKISHGRPLRLRILDHPKNKRAIRVLERALEAAAAIENGQHHEHSDRGVALPPSAPIEVVGGAEQDPSVAAQIEPPAVAEISPPVVEVAIPTPVEPRRTFVPKRAMNWNEAVNIVAAHGGDLDEIARHYVMATAKPGDLLEALLDRGYTVAKTHPRWKD